MMAIVHASFTLIFDNGDSVGSIPVTFVVRSRPGVALEGPIGEPGMELAAKIELLPGWKSPVVMAIVASTD